MNPGDEMGGFRLVRMLGSGTRSRVFLGHEGGRTVAIKVFRPGATPESVDDEIAALSSASHAHVVQLREVGTTGSGLPFLVLERLEATSLAGLQSTRAGLGPGEAVTILAPIVAAVGALHSSGVAHGSIAAGRVLFRSTGAPVLAGLGRATLFVPPSSAAILASSRPVLEDRLALGRLVQSVVSRIDGDVGSLPTWLAGLERDGYPERFTDELSQRVFALGQAMPVRFAVAAPLVAQPSAVIPTAPPPVSVNARTTRSLVARIPEGLSVQTGFTVQRVLAAARSVRRPIWIAAAAGASSLVAALLLVPPPASGEAAQNPVPSGSPVAQAVSAVTADDPALALEELIVARSRCVRDLSVLCLENVDQSGSAAMDDDVALIRSIESGETAGVLPGLVDQSVTLTERHGDAALLAYETGPNSEPASLLLVKGEAGWRIRDYLAG